MVTRPGTRDEIDEFANAIGEWLLTQQFGSIKPLAFRHRLGFSDEDDGLKPYVVIELLVTDPPPPPSREELQRMKTREELAAALSWPLEDWKSVLEKAQAKANEIGPPPNILAYWPVDVRMFAEREVDRDDFPR